MVLLDHEFSRRRVTALILSALVGRCRSESTLANYVADETTEKIPGNLPFPKVREEELLYVLHKLRELGLWPGSLWPAPSETLSKYAKEQPGTQTIFFVPRGLIADSVKLSSCAYMFHFYSLLCEIASVPHKAPSASSRPGPGYLVSSDARELARECLKEVGREPGVPR
ncbi:hypothetical protein V8E52_005847 [Russula decolorans]